MAEGKKGRKVGRGSKEPKHAAYNRNKSYIPHSNPKATHHKTPLEKYHEKGQRSYGYCR
jgi:hypothetical protein